MRFWSATSALALYFASTALAQDQQTCPYTPVWQTCQGPELPAGFQCATLYVPEDYNDENSQRRIPLRLLRYKNSNDNAQSIIFNPGGPGSSGIAALLAGYRYYSALASQYHIVSFDPRGVGLNMPYDCPQVGSFPDNRDYQNQTVLNQLYTYYAAQAANCQQTWGEQGRLISTTFTARDVNSIALKLGDGLIRYWGFSYGTVLGDTIARIYPTRVARMILDGNINPEDYYSRFPVEEANDIDRALSNFFINCADPAATLTQCYWTTPAGQQRTAQSLLDKFSLWVGGDPTGTNRGRSSDSPLGVSQSFIVRSLFFDVLRGPRDWIKWSQILQYWYDNPGQIRYLNQGETIASYAVPQPQSSQPGGKRRRQVDYRYNPSAAGSVSARKALVGISGVDSIYRPANLNGDVYRTTYASYNDKTKFFGEMSVGNVFNTMPWTIQPYERMPVGTFNPNQISTLNPIMYIQTPFDPVTPEASGRAASQVFTNSAFVYYQAVGHCSSADSGVEIQTVIANYWSSGNPPPAEARSYNANRNPFTNQPPTTAPVDNGEGMPENSGNVQKRKLLHSGEGLPTDMVVIDKRDVDYSYMWPKPMAIGHDMEKRQNNNNPDQPVDALTDTVATVDPSCDQDTSTTTTMSSTSTSTLTTTTQSGTVTGTTTTNSNSGTVTGTTTTNSNSATATGTTSSNSYTWTTSSMTTKSGKPTFNPDPQSMWTFWSQWADKPKPTGMPKWNTMKDEPAGPKATSWGSWSSKAEDGWEAWTSQKDSVPVTKTICGKGDNKDWNDCRTTIVAIPTKTVYIDYITDVCETGLTTKVVTVTATCDKGCDVKPTGCPQGYTTTKKYCAACAVPTDVIVTVKVVVDYQTWASADLPVVQTVKGADWTGVPAPAPTTPTKPAADVKTWSDATVTGPKVAKYTGAATSNVAPCAGLLAAIFAGLWLL